MPSSLTRGMVMTNASNSSVKPLSGRAQGTQASPHMLQRTRGT